MKDSITRDKKVQPEHQNGSAKIKIYLVRFLAVCFWLIVWQAASMKLGQEVLLVSPVSVVKKLLELSATSDFWQAVWFSFGRIVAGFFMALFLGAVLAVGASRFSFVEILLTPLVATIKSIPVASFIILCLIWLPSRNLSVFISFLIVLPVIYTNLLEGIRQTDRKLLEMADVFSIGMARRILYIYLSQILPYLMTACGLALGLCWKAGVAAEVIGVPQGSVGEKLYHAKIYLNTPDLFAWTVVIVIISFLFEQCFLRALKKMVEKIERM